MASVFFTNFLFVLCLVYGGAAASNNTSGPIVIPAPPGPYLTKLDIQVMVDTSRPDPYNSSQPYRRLVTSNYTPILPSNCANVCNAQYMPTVTAAVMDKMLNTPGLFERFELSGICCHASMGYTDWYHPPSSLPLLIWSPGFKESRLEWAAMAQYAASYGYQVILVDHPYDAIITEFPDGEIIQGVFGPNNTEQERIFALNVETADVLFVIDSYSKGVCGANRAYNNKVGIIAHGTIAAQAMLNDSQNGHPGRISGGVNLDGRFEGPVLTEGLGPGQKSFLIWVPPSGPNIPATWDEWWNITNKLDPADWRKELELANSTQGTFTDYPLLADISGLRQSNPKLIAAAFGTINGVRSTSILTTYNVAFFDMTVKGEQETLLNGPNAAYPEISFVRSSV